MKKIILLAALPLLLFVTRCSKDQKVVKQLDGDWKTTAMTIDGDPVDAEMYENQGYTFEKCKVRKGDCDGSKSYNDPSKGEISMSFTYSISEKGEKIKYLRFRFVE